MVGITVSIYDFNELKVCKLCVYIERLINPLECIALGFANFSQIK